MRRENGYVIFDNLVRAEAQPREDGVQTSQIKYEATAFTSSNASANTRKVESLEEVAKIAYDMGQNFTKAFAITP